jgi:hypothetical protein
MFDDCSQMQAELLTVGALFNEIGNRIEQSLRCLKVKG